MSWNDNGSVTVTCGGQTITVLPPAKPPNDWGQPSGGVGTFVTAFDNRLAVQLTMLGAKVKAAGAFDARAAMPIAQASDLATLDCDTAADALNLEWTSSEPMVVDDIAKRLEKRFSGPLSVRVRPAKKTP